MKLIIDIPETVNPDDWERIITEVAAEVAEDVQNGAVYDGVDAATIMRDDAGKVESTYTYEEV